MKPFEEQLHTIASQVVLNVDDKALMRERVLEYTRMKPIRTPESNRARVRMPTYHSPWSLIPTGFDSSFRMRLASVVVIAGLVLSSAGVSYAAESALPGDLLYPVKLNVNEGLEGVFIFSEQSRIAWLSERAERRLEEASILSSQGKLDAEKSEQVATQFQTYTDELKTRTQALENNDPESAAQVGADVSTNLQAHEAILARLAVDQGSVSPEAKELVGKVRVAARELAHIGEQAEEKLLDMDTEVVATTSLDAGATDTAIRSPESISDLKENMAVRMRTSARESLDQAYSLLVRINNQESESALRTKESIQSAEAQFTAGQEALLDGDYKQAYGLFKGVNATGRKIARMLGAEVLFQIEILPAVPDTQLGTSSAGTSSVGISSKPSTIQEEKVTNARTRVEAAINETSDMMLAENDYPAELATRAANYLKDAKAFKLRGDIAIVTHDLDEAEYLFKEALNSVERVRVLLQSTPKEDLGVTAEPVSSVQTASDNLPTLPTLPDLPPLDVVQLTHTFKNGIHTFSGVFYTPTKCFTLTASAQVAASASQDITFSLATKEETQNCPQYLDAKQFSVDVVAPEDAKVSEVYLNDQKSRFTMSEATSKQGTSTP